MNVKPGNWTKALRWFLPALAIAALLWFLNRPTSTEPLLKPDPGAMTVARSALELREGRLYTLGSTNTFIGWMVERYEDGALRSRSAVSNGMLHGVSEGWHTNGQIQVTEHFVEGVSHGLRTKWYLGGQLLSRADIVDGKLHGTFTRWHEDGSLAQEIHMKDGEPDGISRAYYPGGNVKVEALMSMGKLVEKKEWADGEHPPSAADATGLSGGNEPRKP